MGKFENELLGSTPSQFARSSTHSTETLHPHIACIRTSEAIELFAFSSMTSMYPSKVVMGLAIQAIQMLSHYSVGNQVALRLRAYFLLQNHHWQDRTIGSCLQGSAKSWPPGLVIFFLLLLITSAWPCLQHSRNLGPTFKPSPVCACALKVFFFSRIMMFNSLAGMMMMMIAADPSLPLPPPPHPIMKVPSCLPSLSLPLSPQVLKHEWTNNRAGRQGGSKQQKS